ncbi:hypothetical protein CAI16_15105 [Virgibacillus dokdonensis]|uniref:Uncharacterized protein n=2 Tax=Virgibacillus TaxID=84406 RepID=A0A2K9IW50_9BACI|nr:MULTISPECIES: hypothetical protein [Virgibacillus]AUJ23634.1 hypothetical protein A21D_00521 [Virgibacillus dokdonensis]RFA33339.1 hypothetical protein CAI16_15105 [Virgibacillus dokdonensis]SHH15275.1 hypothetical protein SAMN05421807_104200 [Virgibacillus chiguensis]
MKDIESITVTEKIVASENLMHKKQILRKYTEEIFKIDKTFFNLMDDIIVNEDQKGEIVEAMKEETKKLTTYNRNLLEHIDKRMNKIVQRLDEQVDEIKSQRMTITYENTPSA